jgi:glutamate N-acetyltransferase/amino-acid N-acetyltransferase
MSIERSPLALPFPAMPAISGATPRVARARYKTWDRCDLTFVELAPGTAVAGVLTSSKCPSPEVEWCRKALPLGEARALVVNAGNSNAFTGNRGRAAVEAIAARAAAHLGCEPSDVFVASTGVIGVPLPIDKAEAGLDAAFTAEPCELGRRCRDDHDHRYLRQGRGDPRGGWAARPSSSIGIIKGSGMIAPDMATMLGFVFTDAAVDPDLAADRR